MYKALLDSDFYYFKFLKTGTMDNPFQPLHLEFQTGTINNPFCPLF